MCVGTFAVARIQFRSHSPSNASERRGATTHCRQPYNRGWDAVGCSREAAARIHAEHTRGHRRTTAPSAREMKPKVRERFAAKQSALMLTVVDTDTPRQTVNARSRYLAPAKKREAKHWPLCKCAVKRGLAHAGAERKMRECSECCRSVFVSGLVCCLVIFVFLIIFYNIAYKSLKHYL